MNHSYEEIRAAAIDLLAGREKSSYELSQFTHLEIGVAEVLMRRDSSAPAVGRETPHLSPADQLLFMEVFWDLFRQGVITLGLNQHNREFPFFRVSSFGQKILQNQQAYFFHDVDTYAKVIRDEIPDIDSVTLIYLQEAMQAFKSGCILSATVMLGVATEHTFLLMLELADASATWKPVFSTASKEWSILQKANKVKKALDQHVSQLPKDIKEDLDTRFAGILSIIREFRNQSGHPTGKIISREQAYILLQLFIPYCKKMYELLRLF